jgi:hypothetical protein
MSRQAVSRIVAIGVGCRAGVAGKAIAALARRALEETGAPEGERRMFTLAAKADEPGRIEAARIIGGGLMGAGEGGRLLGPRLAADGATCAIALSPERPCDGATGAVALTQEQR